MEKDSTRANHARKKNGIGLNCRFCEHFHSSNEHSLLLVVLFTLIFNTKLS